MQMAIGPKRRAFRDNYLAVIIGAAAFLLTAASVNAQIYSKPNPGNFGTTSNRGSFDSTLFFPTGCGVPTDSTWLFSEGFGHKGEKKKQFAIYGDSCGNQAYLWIPSLKAWQPIGQGGGGIDTMYARGDSAFYVKTSVEYFAFILGTGGAGDTNNISRRIDTLSANVDSTKHNLRTDINGKVTNFLNSSFLGYGTYAAKPTSGSGFYYAQDSARLAYISSGTLIWLTDAPGKTFSLYMQKDGRRGIMMLRGHDSVLLSKGLIDSGSVHLFLNPDSTVTIYGDPSSGSGTDSTILSGYAMHQTYVGKVKTLSNDTASATQPGVLSPADYVSIHTPVFPFNDSVGGLVDSIGYYDAATHFWHFKGHYNRYGHKPFSTQLVNYDDIDTTATGLAPYHDLTDTARVLRQAIAAGSGSSPVVTGASITGNGTLSNPLDISIPVGIDTLRLDTFGLIRYDTLYTGLVGNYYSQNGSVSASISGGNILLANTTNNDYGSYLADLIGGVNYYSMLPNWNKAIYVKLTSAPSSTTYGIGVAKLGGYAAEGWIDLTTGANAGKVFINQGSTNLVTSATALSFSQNDIFRMELWMQHDSAYFTVRNMTTGAAGITVSYAFNYVYGQTINPPASSSFGIIQKGGAYTLLSNRLATNIPVNAPLAVVGDSKAQGDFSGSTTASYAALLNSNYTTTINLGGSGDMTSNVLQRISEVNNIVSPKQVILEVASNDLRSITADTVWRNNYKKIVDTLTGAGIKVYHIVLKETALNQAPLVAFIDSFYHDTYIAGVYNSLVACGSACLVADGVHPNARGHDSVYVNIVRDGRVFQGNYRLRLNYVDARKVGKNTSSVSKLLVSDRGAVKTTDPSVIGLLSASGNSFSTNSNAAAPVLVNDNGTVKQSTNNTIGLLQLGGNTFGVPYVFGSKDNGQLQMIYNNVNTIRFQAYPTNMTFYSTIGSEMARFRIDSVENTAIGRFSMQSLTSGTKNVSLGWTSASGLTTGFQNTFIGAESGVGATTASANVYVGFSAAPFNNGIQNVIAGALAASGQSGTTFNQSTGMGYAALYNNKADNNTGFGFRALQNVTTGANNLGVGAGVDVPCITCSNQFNLGNIHRGTMPTSGGFNGADSVFGTMTVLNTPAGNTSTDSIATLLAGRVRVISVSTLASAIGGSGSSGGYLPTLTGVTNTSSATPDSAYFIRSGDICIVTGIATVTATATGTTEVRISLPFSSNLGASARYLNGDGTGFENYTSAIVYCDNTNKAAVLKFNTTVTTAEQFRFRFTYHVN